MDLTFELVRIGKVRKNHTSEMILKQNIKWLKESISSLLLDLDENVIKKNSKINLVMIIPGKGHSIKLVLKDIREKNIKQLLKENFPTNIYNGHYSDIIENI